MEVDNMKYWMTIDEGLYMSENRHNGSDIELSEHEYNERLNPFDFQQFRTDSVQQVEVLLPIILEKGFMYGSNRIQADAVAQQNATGFLTAVSAGVPVPFPIEWRTKANTSVWIADLDEFKTFAAMMLGFVQQVFHDTWGVKDNIRDAVTAEEIDSLIGAYRSKYGL